MTNVQEIARRENELRIVSECLNYGVDLELTYYFNDEPTDTQTIQISFDEWADAAVRVGIFHSYEDDEMVRLFEDAATTYSVNNWIEYTATRGNIEEILKNYAGVENAKMSIDPDKALYEFKKRTHKRIGSEHKCKKLSDWLNSFDYTVDLIDSCDPNFTANQNAFKAINYNLATCSPDELDRIHGKLTASTSSSVCKYFDQYFKDRVSFMQRVAGLATPNIEMKHQPKVDEL